MKRLPVMFLITCLVLSRCNQKNTTSPDKKSGSAVEAWLTTGDKSVLMQQMDDLKFQSGVVQNAIQVTVNSEQTYQAMKGFGAALTNSSAWLLCTSIHRDAMMRALFEDENGIRISYIRLPMGASDFSSQPAYTYDDMPRDSQDLNLENFSIDADREFILPVLKQALAINPDLKIVASPWSAPAWMKAARTLNGGRLRTAYFPSFALYFLKFIQAYAEEGIDIDAITVQNEPLHSTNDYPTMTMTASEQTDFIKNYLGPLFRENGITTQIWVYDHNWDRPDYPLTVLSDAGVRDYVTGSAWHCYGGDFTAQSSVHAAYPEMDIYFTECSGGAWDNDFASVLRWNMSNLFIGSVRHWTKTVLLWNLALDENHGPFIGGCTNCRGVLTVREGDFDKNVEYYTIGHLSKFVLPGAVRIDSQSSEPSMQTVAFQNPDETIVLVVLNAGSDTRHFSVRWNDTNFGYVNFPGSSVITFRW